MSEAERRRWWRAAAAVVLGGGAVVGVWAGLSRHATADSKPPQAVQVGDDAAVWVRTPTPPPPAPAPAPPPAAPAATLPPPATEVVPAAGKLPPLPTPAAVPVPPAAPPNLVVIPPVDPVTPVPRVDPAVTAAGAPPALPTIPAIPPAAAVSVPAVPAPPKADDARPTTLPDIPAPDLKTAPPSLPAIPPAAAPPAPALPSVPVVDTPKPSGPTPAPATPTLPSPSVLPPPAPADVTPSVSPVKLPEPAKSDSSLQNGNGGTTVKTDKPGGGSGPGEPAIPVADPPKPIIPPPPAVPAVGVPGEATGAAADRTKPVDPLRNPGTPGFPIPVPTGPHSPPAPTPGDTTVSTLHQSVAAAVLGGVLLAPSAPARAVPPLPAVPIPGAVAADDKTDLATVKTQVEEANKKLAAIQEQLKLITEALNGKKDGQGIRLESDPGLIEEMKRLKDKLAQVEKDLNAVKTQQQSSSLRPPSSTNPVVDPRAGKATVRVVNDYPVQISIVVNGTSYRVPPSKTLDVEVPAGEFSYQLLESGAAATKSLIKDKETVTLRIK